VPLVAAPCAVCDSLLDRPARGPVCERCWRAIHRLPPPLCVRCGDPLGSWWLVSREGLACPGCRQASSSVDRCRSAGLYEGALRRILQAFKYEGLRSLATPLAARMASAAADLLADADLAVPVPLHRSRRRARGFNQAEELVRALGVPWRRVLVRTRPTLPQAGLTAAGRRRNVDRAFALAKRPLRLLGGAIDVRDRRVLLIDDVRTTGATLEACARVLREGGAARVDAVTAARAVRSPASRRPL